MIHISEHCTVLYLFIFLLHLEFIQSLLYYFHCCIIVGCLVVAKHFLDMKVHMLNWESIPSLYILYSLKLYSYSFWNCTGSCVLLLRYVSQPWITMSGCVGTRRCSWIISLLYWHQPIRTSWWQLWSHRAKQLHCFYTVFTTVSRSTQ